MAYVRDSDTSLWLHNKLGTSNDLWSGGSICSQLKQDVLRNIRDCFIDLQSQVKLKLLLSFLHIPRRSVEEWKVELEEVIEVASADNDQWVSMLAELLKFFPSTGNLNFQIEENAKVFTDLTSDVRKIVRKYAEQAILPLECLYLNRNSFKAIVGELPPPVKHFALKRKPKSAALRAELLQKSSDAASSVKKSSNTPTVPIRYRGLSKSIPPDSRGFKNSPLGGSSNSFRSPLGGGAVGGVRALGGSRPSPSLLNRKKDSAVGGGVAAGGGIKLLDITEQPQGYGRDAKRRKKMADNESSQSSTSTATSVASNNDKKEKEGGMSPAVATTPDYAAGLLPSNTSTANTSVANSAIIAGVGYSTATPTNSGGPNVFVSEVVNPVSMATTSSFPSLASTPPQTSPIKVAVAAPPVVVARKSVPVQQVVATTQPTIQQTQQPPIMAGQKNPLKLSREQMLEAQEMFKSSNKVTRPEKALILGFMAGSRDNPCPQLGNIVTIKLSENLEEIETDTTTPGQSVIVETHFQMNYSTGEWKRVKKYRKADL